MLLSIVFHVAELAYFVFFESDFLTSDLEVQCVKCFKERFRASMIAQ